MAQKEKIIYLENIGKIPTIDLEIDSEYHNFYCNDIVISNSHAVSYSHLAMQTLFLKHYYPTEFYTSLLNHPKNSGSKDEQKRWLSLVITSAISKGIKILPPSRKSGWNWKMTADKEISMGFSGVNGFGEKAWEELEYLLKQGDYDFEKITPFTFFELPFSKFDKKSFEVAVKSGVFDDWSGSRQHLLDLKAKKRKKKDPSQMALFDIAGSEKLEDSSYIDITSEEKKNEFKEVCNFDLDELEKYTKLREGINKESKIPLENIVNFEEDGWYFFIISKIEEVMTKTNKKYLKFTIGDGTNNTWLNMFGSDIDKLAKKYIVGNIYVAKFEKKGGFINIIKNAQSREFDRNIMKFKLEVERSENK